MDKNDPKPCLVTLVRLDAMARGYRLALGLPEKVYGNVDSNETGEPKMTKAEAKEVLAACKAKTPSEYKGIYELALNTAYDEE